MLTKQESEVVVLVSDGMTNKEIAERMFLHPGTVRNYISSALQKLCMSNRAQLASWATRNKVKSVIIGPISDPDNYQDIGSQLRKMRRIRG